MDNKPGKKNLLKSIVLYFFFSILLQGCEKELVIPKGDNFNCYKKEIINLDSIKEKEYMGIYGDTNGVFLVNFNLTDKEENEISFFQIQQDSVNISPVQTKQKFYFQNMQIGIFRDNWENTYLFDHQGYLSRYDDKMELIEEISLVSKCEIDEEEWYDINVRSDEDFIYIHNQANSNGTVFVFNRQWELEDSLKNVSAIFYNNDGVKFLYEGEVYNYDHLNKILKKDEKESLKEKKKEILLKSRIVDGDNQYDYYFFPVILTEDERADKDYNCLYGAKDGKIEKVVNFYDYQLDHEKISIFSDDNSGFIVMETHNLVDGGNVFYRLIPSDKTISDERIIITVAGIESTEELNKVIIDFNSINTKYRVEFRNYAEDDLNDSIRKMQMDLIKGQEIDIIILNDLDFQTFAEGDALLDLNDYFENSTIVKKDDFIPQTIQTDNNGRILSLYPEFTLEGFISVNDEDVRNWKEYNEEKNQMPLLVVNDPVKATNHILKYSGEVYVNEQKKSLSFEDDFTEIMEYLKRNLRENDTSSTPLPGKDARFVYDQIEFPYSYIAYRRLVGTKCNCSNIGFSGAAIIPGGNEFAVAGNTENKQAAFLFLDFIFSEENYSKYFGKIRFPALNREWNKKIEYMRNRENPISYGLNEFSIQIGAIDESEEKELRDLISNSQYYRPMKMKYQMIVEEEIEGYFYGDRELSDIIEQIEKRLQIAINE